MAVAKKRAPKKYYDHVDAFAAVAVDQIEAALDALGYSDLPPIKSLVSDLLKEERERVKSNAEELNEFRREFDYRRERLSEIPKLFKGGCFDLSLFITSNTQYPFLLINGVDDFLNLCFTSLIQLEYLYVETGCEIAKGDFVSTMTDRVAFYRNIKQDPEARLYASKVYEALNGALTQYADIPAKYEDEVYWWAYSEAQYYLGMLAREAGLDLSELRRLSSVGQAFIKQPNTARDNYIRGLKKKYLGVLTHEAIFKKADKAIIGDLKFRRFKNIK